MTGTKPLQVHLAASIYGEGSEEATQTLNDIANGIITVGEFKNRAAEVESSSNALDTLYGNNETAQEVARRRLASGEISSTDLAVQINNRDQNINDIAGGNAEAQSLLGNFSPELQTEIADAFSRLPESEKAAYRQAAAQLSANPPKLGEHITEAQLLATLTLFGGLPTASVLESSGGINGYIRTPAGQAILKRAGFAIRTPIGAASAAVGAGLGVLFLQPKDNPFTDADDDLLIPNPFGGNDPDNNKPPLLIPAPNPDGSEYQEGDENREFFVGTTRDGDDILSDRSGNRFIRDERGNRISVWADGTPRNSSSTPDPVYTNIISNKDAGHILYGDSTGGGHLWPGQPGKTAFPESWSADRVLHEVGDIVTSPSAQWYVQTGSGGTLTKVGLPARWVAYEQRGGVRIRVVYEPATGRTVTSFPDNSDILISLRPVSRN